MELLQQAGFTRILAIWGASLLLHIIFFSVVQFVPRAERAKTYSKVAVNVVEKPKTVEAPPPEPEPKPKEAPKPKPKTPPQPKATPAKKPVDNTPPPQPVMGLSKDSFAEGGKGSFSAPAGNTTMLPDEGKRLSPEEIRKLDRDLSADATLIAGSFIRPEYTAEAEENNLEGSFIIDVYVDAQGKVVEAELRKKIGYGMDERVLHAARNSRFSPRKNPLGQPLAGWTELKIRLDLE
ncbi:energy transducer TonB [Oligoflexus tunisiensis]|uniref:energy transducer TonB n=1 Tax=Oligoflexus tunisiensis TaxID=708132 RepID=UPI000B1D6390|nr:energy transducer TonB [Oligoflexus tunisiensis]